jgi:hypothetical protein
LLVANNPQMNFIQMHERLRLELLRRIQRGTLTVSLLARQTGFGQAHLSNFLRSQRQLSMAALDRVLASQNLTVQDLLPTLPRPAELPDDGDGDLVPLVSHAMALFEPVIRPSAIQAMVHTPPGALKSLRSKAPGSRRAWRRFVAVRIPPLDALAMDPVLLSEAVVVVDRHYNALTPYRPNRPNLYAVRNGSHLLVRYVELTSGRLVLRPHNMSFAVELIEIRDAESPGDLITGRIALIFNEP